MSIKMKQWILFVATVILLVGVILYSLESIKKESSKQMPQKPVEIVRTDVSVISVTPTVHQASLLVYGQTKAHYELTLNSQVSGEVLSLSSEFEVGKRVAKNQTLLTIDSISYRASLATAQTALASAQLALEEEKEESIRAQEEWNRSGFKDKPSDLVLRKPQLAAAKATLNEANKLMVEAKHNLALTTLKSPFDAIVVSRDIALGQVVQSSTQIATLYSTDRLDIQAALSEREWNMLPSIKEMLSDDFKVIIENSLNNTQYSGAVLAQEGALDTTTRQRALIIGVNKPFDFSKPLYPGTFVNIILKGKQIDGLWKLPSSALSQSGKLWYVNKNQTLSHISASILFSDTDSIYIRTPKDLQGITQVLTNPLESYVDDMQVNPIEVK
jgi:RND family efflux transporter MFP subunit